VTPCDVYLVTEHGGRDATRKRKGTRDAWHGWRGEDTPARLQMSDSQYTAMKMLLKSVLKTRILQSSMFLSSEAMQTVFRK